MLLRHALPDLLLGSALLAAATPTPAAAQTDARMFRYPDVSATQIAFVYAGDIWVVPKSGGVANRLSSPAGEESFPRFSPDGSRIAFSANYDGNTDTYVIPTSGGEPVRITYHPMGDRLVDWHPDGRLLFASGRESGRQRYNQFYLVSATGGLPTKMPVPYAEFGSISADGRYLAYTPTTLDFRTWKRYRGGWAPDIWIFDLSDSTARNVSPSDADDSQPMWHGNVLYFLSDRGAEQRHNIWKYDVASGGVSQVTTFRDFDVTFPAIGPTDMVFQAGGRLHLLDLATDTEREVQVEVITDQISLRPRVEKVALLIQYASVSPTGQRALFQARGELITVPAEHGPVLNLSRTSGVAERYPTWSPDGKTVAYWTDRNGEYQLALRPADGSGTERILTTMGPGYRYGAWWSPDGKKLAFADEAMRFHLYDVDRNAGRVIDSSLVWMAHGQLENMRFNWSSDSRWLTWSRPVETSNQAVFLYDTRANELHRATSGYFNDSDPVFDPDGKFLYYLSNRTFDPVYGAFDNTWTYANATQIVAVPLRRDVDSPLAARNDAEAGDTTNRAATPRDTTKRASPDDSARAVAIDLDGFEARAIVLPPPAGNYADLDAASGKVVYRRTPRTGSSDTTATLAYWDLAAREEKSVVEGIDGSRLTHDGKKFLVRKGRQYAFIELKPAQKFEKPIRTGEMEMTVDPRAEWHQMFADAYRFERDFFYDPGMHGVDWSGLRDRYGALIDDAVTRWDVNFVIGEFIAEL
ncbi:MAG TPA: hypothetical protein VFG84_08835, partial [Gemmatimonadaceae bacterium]|nr:hypothetical protein [Gemmatimonadaceae bacterium]